MFSVRKPSHEEPSKSVAIIINGNRTALPPAIATWRYSVSKPLVTIDIFNEYERANWLADLVGHILTALTSFAIVNSYDAMTFSKGDDSFIHDKTSTIIPIQLDHFLRTTSDVSNVSLWLDFLYLEKKFADSSVEYQSNNEGSIFLFNNIKGTELLEGEEDYISVSFTIENSIFSPISHGTDNRALAALNAPRLRAFIGRLAQHPDLVFKEVDCDSNFVSWMRDHNLFDDHGFKMPEDIEAFDRLLKEQSDEV
jgi:hypothetical protein